jgi:hypothetical protein
MEVRPSKLPQAVDPMYSVRRPPQGGRSGRWASCCAEQCSPRICRIDLQD